MERQARPSAPKLAWVWVSPTSPWRSANKYTPHRTYSHLPPSIPKHNNSLASFFNFIDHSLVEIDKMEATENPYKLLLEAASMIPKSHYVIAFSIFGVIYFYNYLEFHFLEDLRTGFRGSPVSLSYHSSSQLYHQVVSKCRILHGRFKSFFFFFFLNLNHCFILLYVTTCCAKLLSFFELLFVYLYFYVLKRRIRRETMWNRLNAHKWYALLTCYGKVQDLVD